MTASEQSGDFVIRFPRGLIKTIGVPIAIVLLGGFFASLLIMLHAPAPRTEPSVERVPVSVHELIPQTYTVQVVGRGSVIPKRKLELRSQVSGYISTVHPRMQVGSEFAAGETLVEIDSRDYQVALDSAKADLERVKAELDLERGRVAVAKSEWTLLGNSLEGKGAGRLALRIPQLKAQQAAYKAAEQRVLRAELDLERTRLSAPFSSVLVRESVELGSFLSPQSVVGELVGTEEFFVEFSLSRDLFRWVEVSNRAVATVTQRVDSDLSYTWEARDLRVIPELEQGSRMLRALVSIPQPLKAKQPLYLGTFVEVQLEGVQIEKAFVFPRHSLREGGVVWLVDSEDRLRVRKVNPVYVRGDDVVVQGGFKEGDRLVLSSLSRVLDGMALQVTGNR